MTIDSTAGRHMFSKRASDYELGSRFERQANRCFACFRSSRPVFSGRDLGVTGRRKRRRLPIVRATCMERAGGVAVRRSILDRVGVKRGRRMRYREVDDQS